MDKLELVDEAYEAKMLGFEIDCREGEGTPMGCHNVGEFYSVVKEDHKRASITYEKNCAEKNFPASCFNLAKLYFAGKGVPQNEEEAMSLFEKSCKLGHQAGCYHYGALLYLSNPDSKKVFFYPAPKLMELLLFLHLFRTLTKRLVLWRRHVKMDLQRVVTLRQVSAFN